MRPGHVKLKGKTPKALKNFKGNAPAKAGLAEFIEDAKVCDDPSRIGERKKGAHRYCYGARLAKSVSLVYSVDCASHVVYILDIGDHKRLYGHDNRS